MLSIVKKMSVILSQYSTAVCFVVFTLTMCLESLHAEDCSNKYHSGTCPAGKTCILNGTTYGCYGNCTQSSFGSCLAGQSCLLNEKNYGCYGKCEKNSFGSCSKDEICLVSLIQISKQLKKEPFYACFTCTNSNPFGTCPAGLSCFTCNGSSTCVTDDFVCKEQATKVESVVNNFVATTTKPASVPEVATTIAGSVPVTATTNAASVPVTTTTKTK